MADRFWVGGSGTWDATTKSNWSATSGGAGGESAPTAADNVFFNASSNTAAATVTIGANALCLAWSVATPTALLSFSFVSTSILGVNGSIAHSATSNFAVNAVSGAILNLWGSGTITTPPIAYGSLTVRIRASGSYVLNAPIASPSVTLNLMQGGFDNSAGHSMSLSVFQAGTTGSSASNLKLGAASITCANTFELSNSAVITASVADCNITITSPQGKIVNSAYALGDVYFNGKTAGTITISGGVTGSYKHLRIDSASSDGTIHVLTQTSFSASKVTYGAANTPNRNMVVYGDLVRRIITAAEFTATSNVQFTDIQAAGASSPWAGTRFSDGGGNQNITFAPGVNRYWYSAGGLGAAWKSASWTNLPTDTVGSLDNIPMAQDVAIFRDVGLNSGAYLSPQPNSTRIDVWTIDASARTLPMSLNTAGNIWVHKDLQLSSAVSWGAGNLYLAGKNEMTVRTAGNTIASAVLYSTRPAVVRLLDPLTLSGGMSTAAGGDWDFGTFTHTVNSFTSNASSPRSVIFGVGSEIHLKGSNTTVFNTQTDTGLTYTGTPNFKMIGAPTTGIRSVLTSNNTNAPLPNITVTGGTDTINLFYRVNNLDMSNFGGTLGNSTRFFGGNLTYGSATKRASGATVQTFYGSGNSNLTLNGVPAPPFMIGKAAGGSVTVMDNSPSFQELVNIQSGDLVMQAGGTATFSSISTTTTNIKRLKSTDPLVPANIAIPSGVTNFIHTSLQGIKVNSQDSELRAYTNAGNSGSYKNENLGNNEGIKFIPAGMTMMSFM